MNNNDIKELLIKKLKLKDVSITGDNNHINIVAIGNIFKGMSQVKRQQTVYTPLIEIITKKHLHAISINSYTYEEWKKNNKDIN